MVSDFIGGFAVATVIWCSLWQLESRAWRRWYQARCDDE